MGMATKATWTIADYMALDEPDGSHYELSEGELIVSPSPTFRHNQIKLRLAARLDKFATQHGLGFVTSETDFQLGSATVRRPDVAIILTAHFLAEYQNQIPIPMAPDLAFEVVSASDRAADLLLKTGQYLSAGTASVWLLHPEAREAHRYQPGATQPQVISASGRLESSSLPGWSLPLSEILPAT